MRCAQFRGFIDAMSVGAFFYFFLNFLVTHMQALGKLLEKKQP
jgi:hypothetical protein